MQATHFWNQLHLRRSKIIFLLASFLTLSLPGSAQGLFGLTSASGSDDKLISYGFFLAGHTSTYQIKYSDRYFEPVTAPGERVYSIYPKYNPGFSLGFTGILRFHDQVNLMFTPKIGFYEYRVDVNYVTGSSVTQPGTGNTNIDPVISNLGYRTEELVNEATMVELPLLFKYRSQRFNNTRMYFIGGELSVSYQIPGGSQFGSHCDCRSGLYP